MSAWTRPVAVCELDPNPKTGAPRYIAYLRLDCAVGERCIHHVPCQRTGAREKSIAILEHKSGIGCCGRDLE